MFNIHNSFDKLALLESDFERMKENPLDISLAEKTCIDAWHLCDWLFSEIQESDKKISKDSFRSNLFLECPEMRILHDLANISKHKKLSKPKVKLIRTLVQGGDYSSDYSKDYNVSRIEVHYNEHSKIDVDDLIKLAIDYWRKRLKLRAG